ncbi:hypothetical protein ACJX0J_012869, partial [Zea mays]
IDSDMFLTIYDFLLISVLFKKNGMCPSRADASLVEIWTILLLEILRPYDMTRARVNELTGSPLHARLANFVLSIFLLPC